ncbi:hypothetical protein WN943_001747 [Citrus x changshan-huyou]
MAKKGNEEKKAAVQEEVKRMNKLPANSAYASHCLRVLNKILQLMSQPRTSSKEKELELLFAGLSLFLRAFLGHFVLSGHLRLAMSCNLVAAKQYQLSYFPGRRFPAFGACINCGHGCVTVVAAVVGAAIAPFFNDAPDYGCALFLHPVASIFATISAAIVDNALDASPCSSFDNGFPDVFKAFIDSNMIYETNPNSSAT